MRFLIGWPTIITGNRENFGNCWVRRSGDKEILSTVTGGWRGPGRIVVKWHFGGWSIWRKQMIGQRKTAKGAGTAGTSAAGIRKKNEIYLYGLNRVPESPQSPQ